MANYKDEKLTEEMYGVPTNETVRRGSVVDDVFGEIKEDGPNYRDVRIWQNLHAFARTDIF